MGTHRTVAAAAQASALTASRAQAAGQSRGTDGHPLYPSTGLRWDLLPQEMGCGSGMSCWRRFRDWQAAAACGTSYTKCFLHVCVRLTKSIGPGSSSTPLQSVPWALVKNGIQSYRPRATRFKASPHYRSAGHCARGDPDGCQSTRCHPAPCTG